MSIEKYKKMAEELTALRAEVERLQADARLGRMVRRMRPGDEMWRPNSGGWALQVSGSNLTNFSHTPEEALIAAGCGEVEE